LAQWFPRKRPYRSQMYAGAFVIRSRIEFCSYFWYH